MMMKAWVVKQWGSLADVVLSDVPQPVPGPGQALVRVRNASLNFADNIVVKGSYQVKVPPPFVLGSEVAGEIVAAGPGSSAKVGDRVMAQVWAGAYAEYCVVDDYRLIALPSTLDFATAVTLPVSYTTAYVALFTRGGLKAGETVVVHASAGAVGIAAVQLAKWAGAIVIATAGSADKIKAVQRQGADHSVNYKDADWVEQIKELAPKGVDLVIDPVGGAVSEHSIRLLGWGGRLMLVGFASGSIPQLPANRLLVKAASAHGVYWNYENDGSLIADIQSELVTLCDSGAISPVIGRVVAFEDLLGALAEIESGQTTGKLVLTV